MKFIIFILQNFNFQITHNISHDSWCFKWNIIGHYLCQGIVPEYSKIFTGRNLIFVRKNHLAFSNNVVYAQTSMLVCQLHLHASTYSCVLFACFRIIIYNVLSDSQTKSEQKRMEWQFIPTTLPSS